MPLSRPSQSSQSYAFVRIVLGSALALTACASEAPLDHRSAPVVYGEDDRHDVYEFPRTDVAANVREFGVALMATAVIDAADPANVQFRGPTHGVDLNLCPGERFADQRAAAFCSGTLIAPDLVLTAGHCVDDVTCGDTRFVFGYYMDGVATPARVTTGDIFACRDILARQDNDTLDFAIVRMDRPATGRTPAPIARDAATISQGTPLIVSGCPSGLPIKIDDGGAVRDARDAARDYFVANLDTFYKSSGSGVFEASTGTLAGILVRGDTDYVQDGACVRPNVCADNACDGEDSTYAFRAVEALCSSGLGPADLCGCGDGTCSAADGETAATCPADCTADCEDDRDSDGITDCDDACPDDPTDACNPAEPPAADPTLDGGGCRVSDSNARFGGIALAYLAIAVLRIRRRNAPRVVR